MIEKLHKEYDGKVEFIGVNLGIKKDIPGFIKEKGITFPVVYDDSKKMAKAFDAEILTSILIDKEGTIVYKERELPEDIDKYLKRLIGQ